MPKPLSITFLGTCSGGGPTLAGVSSSRASPIRVLTVIFAPLSHCAREVVDCAEGTQLQLLKAKIPKASKISKIFITHLHVDHCSGIVPFMANVLTSAHSPGKSSKLDDMLRLELYGPSGLRKLVRTNLQITRTLLRGKYSAHELLSEHDMPTTCDKTEMHQNEIPGRDIRIDCDGRWSHFEDSHDVRVDAAPIVHRVPCLGYVFTEYPHFRLSKEYLERLDAIPVSLLPNGVNNSRSLLSALLARDTELKPVLSNNGTIVEPPPQDVLGRKVVILGDTSDPSAIIPLAQGASLLVHEATNAWLPPALEKRTTLRSPAEVREKAISRGHSTPDMAGEFANTIGAQMLFLNHFSVKFPDPGPSYTSSRSTWARVMKEIEDQASRSWKMGRAVAASDLLVVHVPAPGQDTRM